MFQSLREIKTRQEWCPGAQTVSEPDEADTTARPLLTTPPRNVFVNFVPQSVLTQPGDPVRLRSFLTLYHFELDRIPLIERLETVHVYGGVVYKHIWAAILTDKAIPLGVVEPLDLALKSTHCLSSLISSLSPVWV